MKYEQLFKTSYIIGLFSVKHTICLASISDVDECQSSPCYNNGTCVDGTPGWDCACLPGYIGNQCQIGTYLPVQILKRSV